MVKIESYSGRSSVTGTTYNTTKTGYFTVLFCGNVDVGTPKQVWPTRRLKIILMIWRKIMFS
jgi:hypothetical protein